MTELTRDICGMFIGMYVVGELLLAGMKSFYQYASSAVRVSEELIESVGVGVGVR